MKQRLNYIESTLIQNHDRVFAGSVANDDSFQNAQIGCMIRDFGRPIGLVLVTNHCLSFFNLYERFHLHISSSLLQKGTAFATTVPCHKQPWSSKAKRYYLFASLDNGLSKQGSTLKGITLLLWEVNFSFKC